MTFPRVWLGAALVLAAAVLLSSTSVSAVVSYGGGANPSAAIVVRFVGAVIVLYGLLRLTGAPIGLAPRERLTAVGLGAAQAAQSYFLYTSFAHIPIGLTLIIFYVYPLMIGLLAAAIGQERLTWTLGGGLVVAFIGLLLVFNVTGEGLNFIGAVTAALAAVSWTIVVVFSAAIIRGRDSRPFTLHVQGAALVLFSIAVLAFGEFRFPNTVRGWTGCLLMPVFYGTAMTLFFAATAMVGSVRTGLIMNFEPVASIVLAYLVLGQTLTPMQLAGGALVISALIAVRWDGGRRGES